MSNLSNSPAPALFWGLQAKPAGNSGFMPATLSCQRNTKENQKTLDIKTKSRGHSTNYGRNPLWENALKKRSFVPSGEKSEGLL
jgi:hypothetical protein